MINFNSASQLSVLFFGGELKEECQIPIINELGVQEIYKSGPRRGEGKTKKGIKVVQIKGLGLTPLPEWKTKKEGIYCTNESVLKLIALKNNDAGRIAKLMLKIREKEKLLGTYYTGFQKYIHTDSCVHGQINHCSTDTGRTSANKPNIQNVPRD